MSQTATELEKSMRRVEIRKLWRRGNYDISISEILSLSIKFMTHAMESHDYRFLNTALKLNDRLREEYPKENKLKEIEELEHHCLETLQKRLGIV
ncbi:MAG: hypothetical protein F6K21_16025 [Symploca sp. SIO2D2]|nr:hypothetical protein [Symploca sp. SIO2D2]